MHTPYFRIRVIDAETGRGVPLIRLFATGTCTEHFTDSNGLIAYYEPGLMGRPVYFYVDGHGYCLARNEFGERGIELVAEPGGEAVIRVERLQPAQRIYRITGQGIYHDTLLLGEKPPIEQPTINAGVCGQDSVQTAVYKGKVFWLWGDTKSPRYPGYWNFKVTAATSDLPEAGGLDPDTGVNLHYFADGDFTRQMAPLPGRYLYWLGSLHTVRDEKGEERLLAFYAKVAAGEAIEKEVPVHARREEDEFVHRTMGHGRFRVVGRGRCIFNDETGVFEGLEEREIDQEWLASFGSAPVTHTESGRDYLYFTHGTPCVRVPQDIESLGDSSAAEVFTCLKPGCRKAQNADDMDRDEQGRLRWGWKRNANVVDPQEAERLARAGLLREGEKLCRFTDIATGQTISACGSFAYNSYRKRWIAILMEVGGTSSLGEVWYLEADTVLGPWVYARKVVTHNNYSFYNVMQHPYFDGENGRQVYFEGTYTYTFTHPLNTHPTPRYDYNQIMYKLDLDDPRLYLPVPIYRYDDAGTTRYGHHGAIPDTVTVRERAFFAPDRARAGTVAVHEGLDRKTGARILTRVDYDVLTVEQLPVAFFGIAPETGHTEPMTAPLYEYTHVETAGRVYGIRPPADVTRYYRSSDPICLVWTSPIEFDPFAAGKDS